jgi:hypothetical protein
MTRASANPGSVSRTRRPTPRDGCCTYHEGLGTEPVLLVVMNAAEAHPENVMRPLTRAGIRR